MFTIKSISAEGTYYLSCNWRKNKALWLKENELKEKNLFMSIAGAKNALSKLLATSPEYWDDMYSIVEIRDGVIYLVKELTVQITEKEFVTNVKVA